MPFWERLPHKMEKSENYSFLGIDTSNYTTSLSLVDCDECGNILAYYSSRKILDVQVGERGLRQSEAHFAHTKAIPELSEKLFAEYTAKNSKAPNIVSVGCSDKPRNVENSYMPCFLAGVSAASIAANALSVPLYKFSHQSMHIASAIYSTDKCELFEMPHLAYHVSGGTTELLHVTPNENEFKCEIIGSTLDISAGQLLDRVGVMLGMKFPCGVELERVAASEESIAKVAVNGCNMNLSGYENKCKKMIEDGYELSAVSRYAIDIVKLSLYKTAQNGSLLYPGEPIVFAGGVSGNTIIKEYISQRLDSYFAQSGLSSDNAVGTAILASRKYFKR